MLVDDNKQLELPPLEIPPLKLNLNNIKIQFDYLMCLVFN